MTANVQRALVVGGAGVTLLAVLMVWKDDGLEGVGAPLPASGVVRTSSAKDVPVVDVRLELLQHASPAGLEDIERNLFRYASLPVPTSPPVADTTPRPVAPPVAVVTGPPAPPAIPLKYIGLLTVPAQAGLVAILSDGRGNIFHGREGDTIEGRYRVLQVNPAAAELSYLDGRGRQTIRLSGQ